MKNQDLLFAVLCFCIVTVIFSVLFTCGIFHKNNSKRVKWVYCPQCGYQIRLIEGQDTTKIINY